MTETRHKRPHIVPFIWNIQNKQINRQKIVKGWGRRDGEWLLETDFFWGNKNLLELYRGWSHNSVNILKIFKLYTTKWWILWYVNFILITFKIKIIKDCRNFVLFALESQAPITSSDNSGYSKNTCWIIDKLVSKVHTYIHTYYCVHILWFPLLYTSLMMYDYLMTYERRAEIRPEVHCSILKSALKIKINMKKKKSWIRSTKCVQNSLKINLGIYITLHLNLKIKFVI